MHALKSTFQRAVADHLPHELTTGQSQAVEVFFHHVMDGPPMGAMLLSGFAEQSVGQKASHCINACMEQSLTLCSHVMHASRVELLFSSH